MHLLCINHGFSLIRGSASSFPRLSTVSLQTEFQCSYQVSQNAAPAEWLLTQHSNCVSITHLGSPHRAEKGRCCLSGIKLKPHSQGKTKTHSQSSKGAGREVSLLRAGQLPKPRGLEVLVMFSPTWSFSWFRSSRVTSPVEGTSWAHSHERMADGEAAWLLSADSQRTDGFYLPLEITGRTALWSSPSCLWAYPQPTREGLPWLSTVFFCSTGCDTAWDMKDIPSH